MRRSLIVFTAFSALLLPSTAVAGEWKALGGFSDRNQESAGLNFGTDRAGVFTAVFRDLNADDELGDVNAREREPGGRIRSVPSLEIQGPSLPSLAVTPDGERLVAYGTGPSGTARVELRTLRPDGDWSEPTVIAQGLRRVGTVRIVAAPNGEAVVAWFELPSAEEQIQAPPHQRVRGTIYAASRSGGSFGAPQKLGTVELTDFRLALDDAGNAVLAWLDESAGVLRAARRPAAGAFAAPEALEVPDMPATSGPDLAVAPGGRAVLAWTVGESDPVSRGPLAATAGTTTGGFDAPRVVTRNSGSYGDVAADDEVVAVTWVEDPSVRGRIRSALAGPDQSIGDRSTRTVSSRGVRSFGYGQTAIARGRVTLAWDRQSRGDRVVEARTATSDGDFTRTQRLSSPSLESFSVTTETSRRGEPWVAWVSRDARARLDGVQTAKASSRTGVFGRILKLPRVPSLDVLELVPGRGGTMFAVQRRDYLQAHVYGER